MMYLFVANILLSLTIGTLATSYVAHASDNGEKKIADTFARPIERAEPKYPRSAQARGEEGWVDVSYVVQPDGTVTDPIMETSSGIRAFERSALRTVKKWKFEPATRNGKPVEQCHTRTRLTFMFEGKGGARRNFRRFYEKSQKLIESGEFDNAETLIEEQREKGKWNIYEYSRMWLLKSLVAEGQGNEQEKLSALYRTVGKNGEYIEEDLYKNLLPTILLLEIRLSKYSAAIDTYEKLKKFPKLLEKNEQLVAIVDSLMDSIRSDRIISVPGKILECSEGAERWSYSPLRQEFAFNDVSGKLDQFELRCDWKHYRDDAGKDVSWRIPESWGKCHLYVYGEPGTTFKFVEYPEEIEG